MVDWFENKTISVVGNAESLFSKNYGEIIDQAEVVCRLNKGILHNSPISHGTKLDVLVYSEYSIVQRITNFTLPEKQFWCSSFFRERKPNHPISFYPLESLQNLKRKIGVDRPTTGIMFLDYLTTCNAKSVNVFGFDWKATPTFYNKQRTKEPHNYTKEKEYCLNTFTEFKFFF